MRLPDCLKIPLNPPLQKGDFQGQFPCIHSPSFRNPPTEDIRNLDKTMGYWIPDLDFVSSGMTFGAFSRLFQQPTSDNNMKS
jgi:hypothetical protein